MHGSAQWKTQETIVGLPGLLVLYVFSRFGGCHLSPSEVVFGVIMRKVIRRGSFTSVADLRTKLLNFIAYFNQVFAKPFRWTYTGRPLMKAAA